MKKTHELLLSLLSSSIAKWSKKNSIGFLILTVAACTFLNIVLSIVWTPICLVVFIPIFILFLITWGLIIYHWHRRQQIEEKKLEEEIEESKNDEKRRQEKHLSELLQGEKTADAQREIAKQIVQVLMENPNISELSMGNNPVLGKDFHITVSKQQDQGKHPKKSAK